MKKEIRDPAVMEARQKRDWNFNVQFLCPESTTAQFGRNRVLKGQKRTKPTKK